MRCALPAPTLQRRERSLHLVLNGQYCDKKAVSDKVPAMLSIMFDVLTDANLDSQQRVVEMLKESKVR